MGGISKERGRKLLLKEVTASLEVRMYIQCVLLLNFPSLVQRFGRFPFAIG